MSSCHFYEDVYTGTVSIIIRPKPAKDRVQGWICSREMLILLLNLTSAQGGEGGRRSVGSKAYGIKTDAPLIIMEQSDYSEVWVVFWDRTWYDIYWPRSPRDTGFCVSHKRGPRSFPGHIYSRPYLQAAPINIFNQVSYSQQAADPWLLPLI